MKKLLAGLLLVSSLGTAFALTQEEKKAAPAGAPTDDPMAAMMAKMEEYRKVGPAHKLLDPKAGKWNLEVKMFMDPKAPPEVSKGTAELKWIMDGRYLIDTTTGEFAGQKFDGHGMTGYDNLKKKYVSTWIDNFGSGIYYSEGTYDAASKTFTFTGEMPDCLTGKFIKGRMTEKWTDNDHWTMQSYKPGPDGKEVLGMEINYTRAK